jgi:FLVCR family MFS transporter 7
MGAALLLSGIVAAIASSPVFDRVLTHHLGTTVRILCPIIAVAWLSLIWAGKPSTPLFTIYSNTRCSVRAHNVGVLFAIFVIIGVCSIALLPVAIELGVELTRNPDGSSAVLWFLCVPFSSTKTKQKLNHCILFRKCESAIYHLHLE